MPNRPVPLWYVFVAVFISFSIALGLTFSYINKIDREWCQLLSEMNTAYNSSPPSTQIGQRVAAAIKQLYEEKC